MTLAASFAARKAYFLLALAILVVDQVTKVAADVYLAGRGAVTIVPGFFNLAYSRNRGGLFGYFGNLEDPWRILLLTVFPLAAVAVIALFLAKTDEPDKSTLSGLAMILGGATGNLIDRVLRGEVVDFLDVYVAQGAVAEWLLDRFGTTHWPTFNIADSAIVCGAALLLLDVIRPESRKTPPVEPR